MRETGDLGRFWVGSILFGILQKYLVWDGEGTNCERLVKDNVNRILGLGNDTDYSER